MKILSFVLICTAAAVLSTIGAAKAGTVDWADLNEAFRGAENVKDASVCWSCHETQEAFDHTAHARAFQFGEVPAGGECESCHGPRSEHVADPEKQMPLTSSQWNNVCMQCHQSGDHLYWKSGVHQAAGVGCMDCHAVMEVRSDEALLAADRQESVCYGCHAEVKAQMQKVYHHPVREGKMTCSDCHNVHGSVGKNLLKGATVNEVCFDCHQEKRGPFVWQHAPVLENCANCHNAHGSNHRDLLNSKGSFLCLQCHSYGGHVNLPRYNRTSNPYGQGCVNCHMTQHGSNSPSGAKFTR